MNYTIDKVKVPGLNDFAWDYTNSRTEEELDDNRRFLTNQLRSEDQWYIQVHWLALEHRFINYYIRKYPNLGVASSQRVEGYHPVIREVTNGQLSIEDSV